MRNIHMYMHQCRHVCILLYVAPVRQCLHGIQHASESSHAQATLNRVVHAHIVESLALQTYVRITNKHTKPTTNVRTHYALLLSLSLYSFSRMENNTARTGVRPSVHTWKTLGTTCSFPLLVPSCNGGTCRVHCFPQWVIHRPPPQG